MAQISEWVRRYYRQFKNGFILDLAGGTGRHARFLSQKGFKLVLVDNQISKAKDLQDVECIKLVEYDLRLVIRYLFQQVPFRVLLLQTICIVLSSHSCSVYWTWEVYFIYETFAVGHKNMDAQKSQLPTQLW